MGDLGREQYLDCFGGDDRFGVLGWLGAF